MKISFTHKCMIALTVALIALSYIFYFREGNNVSPTTWRNIRTRMADATRCIDETCKTDKQRCSSWNPSACTALNKCITNCNHENGLQW